MMFLYSQIKGLAYKNKNVSHKKRREDFPMKQWFWRGHVINLYWDHMDKKRQILPLGVSTGWEWKVKSLLHLAEKQLLLEYSVQF